MFRSESKQFHGVVRDPNKIPRHLLESNDELINLLAAREMLRPIPKTGSRSQGSKCSASSSLPTTSRSNHTSKVTSSGTSARSSPLTTLVNSDGENESEVEISEVAPYNYQRMLVERATLESSPATSSEGPKRLFYQGSNARRDNATYSSPASSDRDEVEQRFKAKAAAKTCVTLYVFPKVNGCFLF